MAPIRSRSLALLQTLFTAAFGLREFTPRDMLAEMQEVKVATKKWNFEGNPKMICGGSTIWSLLSGPAADAENIDWGKVESYQQTHLDQLSSQKSGLEEQLAALQKRLEEALKKESLSSTGMEQHTSLISAGAKIFGGLEAAYELKCGKPGVRSEKFPRAVRGAFQKAMEAFTAASSEFFEKKDFRLDSKAFLADCQGMLVKDEKDDKATRCPRMCQRMKDIAQKDSYAAVGEVAVTSDKIKDEIDALRKTLAGVVLDIEQCTNDASSLSTFKDQLAGLAATHEKCYDAWAKAEEGLDDALWSMEDLAAEVDEAQEAVEAGLKQLEESKGDTADAKTALEDAIAKEKDLVGKVTGLQKALAETGADVTAAAEATNLIAKLKELVEFSMMRMEMYFDAGVREPIKNIGFTEDDEVIFPETLSLDSAGVMKEAVTNMYDYCEDTAKPVFTDTLALMPGLDLSPLCAFENVDSMFTDLTAQVDKRKKNIKQAILTVVSWLNPWKDFEDVPMEAGKEKELALVREGQLMYLEQVKPIYKAPENAFWKYLIEWRKNGKHHQLIAKLGEALAALKEKEAALKAALLEMDKALAAAKEATALAKKNLEEAKKKEEASSGDVAGLESALAALEENQSKLEDDIEAWREKVAKALEAMNAARAVLDKAFAEGIAV